MCMCTYGVCVCVCVFLCVHVCASFAFPQFPRSPRAATAGKVHAVDQPHKPSGGTLKLVDMYVYTHMLPKLLGMMGPTGSGVADPHPSGKAAKAAHAQAANRGAARGNAAEATAPRGATRAAPPTRVRIAGRPRCITARKEAT